MGSKIPTDAYIHPPETDVNLIHPNPTEKIHPGAKF